MENKPIYSFFVEFAEPVTDNEKERVKSNTKKRGSTIEIYRNDLGRIYGEEKTPSYIRPEDLGPFDKTLDLARVYTRDISSATPDMLLKSGLALIRVDISNPERMRTIEDGKEFDEQYARYRVMNIESGEKWDCVVPYELGEKFDITKFISSVIQQNVDNFDLIPDDLLCELYFKGGEQKIREILHSQERDIEEPKQPSVVKPVEPKKPRILLTKKQKAKYTEAMTKYKGEVEAYETAQKQFEEQSKAYEEIKHKNAQISRYLARVTDIESRFTKTVAEPISTGDSNTMKSR